MRHTKLILPTLLAAFTLITMLAGPTLASNEGKDNDKKFVTSDQNKDKDNDSVGSNRKITISNKGQVELEGVKVTSINTPVITVTSTWGSAVFTWNVKTSDSTKYTRRYSGISTLSEVSVGDLLSVRGTLDTSTSQPTVNATWVKDWSIQTNSTFRGTIESIDAAAKRMVISKESTRVTVQASATTEVRRGSTNINFADLVVGESVSATGLYNNLSTTLQATKITANQPKRQVFEGKLNSLSGTTKPTSLVLTSGSQDYTVQLATDTSVLNYRWLRVNLTDFATNNSLQVYGAIRPSTGPGTIIDATIVRNMSIR